MSTDEKIIWLRNWLRYHGDYSIKIYLWDLYGTVSLAVYHRLQVLTYFRGTHFEKRLDEAIAYCKTIDPLPL
jgi:hypothetical protein